MRLFHVTGILCLTNLSWQYSYEPSGSQVCVATCQNTLSAITFAGPIHNGYYRSMCKGDLRTQSLFQCAKLYCSPEEIVVGNIYVNKTCEQYANHTLPSYHVLATLTREKLQQMALDDEKIFNSGKIVNGTILPPADLFHMTFKTLDTWGYEMNAHHNYGFGMYIYWACVVVISLIAKAYGYLIAKSSRQVNLDVEVASTRAPQSLLERLKTKISYLVLTPAAIGHKSVEPYGWFTVPPLVQSLTVLGFVVLNVVFCAISYHAFPGNTYWDKEEQQIWRYVSDRAGIIAFSNLPLIWLFGTRNNFLLWVTGWSPVTFNSFHRWVARVATIEAALHAIGYTVCEFLGGGTAYYYEDWKQTYWIFGGVAVILMSILCGISVYGLRKRHYDLFLILHIVFSIVVLIACFFHVKIFDGEYNAYLYATTAIWSFDRLFRIIRLVTLNFNRFKHGQHVTGTYSEGSNIVSIDVPISVPVKRAPGSFYYIYVLNGWRSYQSHPFTSSFCLASTPSSETSSKVNSPRGSVFEKEATVVDDSVPSSLASHRNINVSIDYSRLRFHIRPFSGFTSRLRDMVVGQGEHGESGKLRLLVEGPYGSIEPLHHFDNVLFVVGGAGLTVALQYLQELLSKKKEGKCLPKVHMLWSVRQTRMLVELGPEVRAYENELNIKFTVHATTTRGFPVAADKDELEIGGWSAIRGRPNLDAVVRNERSDALGNLAVVSCCPPAMCDDTRLAVVRTMRETQLDITYFQESFSW